MRQNDYQEHTELDSHGFKLVDAQTEGRNLIWVGYGGMEGRWLRVDEAEQLLADLTKTIAAHRARTRTN
jgi:hypothetical protein